MKKQKVVEKVGDIFSKTSESINKWANKLWEVSENMKQEEELRLRKQKLEEEYAQAKVQLISKLIEKVPEDKIPQEFIEDYKKLKSLKVAIEISNKTVCKNCGSYLGEADAYCTTCGTKII